MKNPTLSTVYQAYEEYLQTTHSSQRATQVLNQFRSVLLRVILPVWGFERTSLTGKMTQADTHAAIEFLKTLPVSQLFKMQAAVQQGFDLLQSSKASRNTYGSAVDRFLDWAKQEGYFPKVRSEQRLDQCCPQIVRGRGSVSSLRLTERTGKYKAYALKRKEMSPELQREMDELERFLTSKHYPCRVTRPILPSSARSYRRELERMLGFMARHANQPVPLSELRLSTLIPYLPEEDLAQANSGQQKKLWKPLKSQLEHFICDYFDFIEWFSESYSPSTRANKLTALIAVLKFLYHQDVQERSEYKTIPLSVVLSQYLKDAMAEKQQWQSQRQRTVDETKKFPDLQPGKTALDIIREEVLEPLRLECRPRYEWGGLREKKSIAISLQRLLQWAMVSLYPARRQQEQCTLKLALACPIQRPESVPTDGWYLPLPEPEERERMSDHRLADNFLFRTYHHEGQDYPNGAYVLDVRSYKTKASYGDQAIVLDDRAFKDGSTFYEYLERYLCGWWVSDGMQGETVYGWWDPMLRGRRGRWLTAGRLSLLEPGTPADEADSDDEAADASEKGMSETELMQRWNHFFLRPRSRTPFSDSSYTKAVEVPAHRLIEKRTSPHTMRYIWATWAIQKGADDQTLASLAYSMGHTIEVLKRLYERCTVEEKRRPIEQMIEQDWHQSLTGEPVADPTMDVPTLIEAARCLSSVDRQRLVRALSI